MSGSLRRPSHVWGGASSCSSHVWSQGRAARRAHLLARIANLGSPRCEIQASPERERRLRTLCSSLGVARLQERSLTWPLRLRSAEESR